MLEQRFKDNWASRTTVRYENVRFTQPANAAWVAFFIRFGTSAQVSCGTPGTRMERHSGAIVIQVFVPKATGQKTIQEHCDFAGGIFRMQTLSADGIEVICRTPYTTDVGENTELNQKTVSIPFQLDALF